MKRGKIWKEVIGSIGFLSHYSTLTMSGYFGKYVGGGGGGTPV